MIVPIQRYLLIVWLHLLMKLRYSEKIIHFPMDSLRGKYLPLYQHGLLDDGGILEMPHSHLLPLFCNTYAMQCDVAISGNSSFITEPWAACTSRHHIDRILAREPAPKLIMMCQCVSNQSHWAPWLNSALQSAACNCREESIEFPFFVPHYFPFNCTPEDYNILKHLVFNVKYSCFHWKTGDHRPMSLSSPPLILPTFLQVMTDEGLPLSPLVYPTQSFHAKS